MQNEDYERDEQNERGRSVNSKRCCENRGSQIYVPGVDSKFRENMSANGCKVNRFGTGKEVVESMDRTIDVILGFCDIDGHIYFRDGRYRGQKMRDETYP